MHELSEMACNVFVIAEAAIPVGTADMAKAQAKRLNMSLILTGTDPEQGNHHAGVGIMVRAPTVLKELGMSSTKGEDAQAMGRMLKGAVQQINGDLWNIIGLYGWSGADKDVDRARRTNALVEAARVEEAATGHVPTYITGDLNAQIDTLPALKGDRWLDRRGQHYAPEARLA